MLILLGQTVSVQGDYLHGENLPTLLTKKLYMNKVHINHGFYIKWLPSAVHALKFIYKPQFFRLVLLLLSIFKQMPWRIQIQCFARTALSFIIPNFFCNSLFFHW